MSDRGLLELAAKAAKYPVRGIDAKMVAYLPDDAPHLVIGNEQGGDSVWNPLANDADALRLAVKLNLQISIVFEDFMHDREFVEVRWDTVDGREFQVREHGSAPFYVTRRAIVRAAAEVALKRTSKEKA